MEDHRYSEGHYIVAKHVLLNSLLDMKSLYFTGIWGYITTGEETKTIKTLWNQN